jgi:hypothetical protein
MVNESKRHALSLLIAAGGCVAGAYSAYAAFSNGKLITDGIPGTMFGLAFAAVVAVSWIMLPWADKRAEEGSHRDAWLWRTGWLMAVGFVLANSIVYTVHYRTEMTEGKGLTIETHERALQAEALATAELNALRANPRWQATSGCSDITAARSKQYCEQIRNAEARLQSAEAILGQGRPASKDSGSEVLAWVLGADEAKIRRSLPIYWAVILELVASLCIREAFASLRPAKAFKAGPQPMALYREPGLAEAPRLGILAPFNFQKDPFQQGAPMNDNVPLAAYA